MPIFRQNEFRFIQPEWAAAHSVKAFTTTRIGGASQPPFDGFNLATHVGDSYHDVVTNRQQLVSSLSLPSSPCWLDQVHSDRVIQCTKDTDSNILPQADASWTDQPNRVLAVMTADCLPLFVSDVSGTVVAAIHAGWKGLLNQIIIKTLSQLPVSSDQLHVWIGPAISQPYFEVGQEVFQQFIDVDERYRSFFAQSSAPGKWLLNLPGLAEFQLNQGGVTSVFQSQLCSYHQAEWFYSYRREGQTGRMASLIWIEPSE